MTRAQLSSTEQTAAAASKQNLANAENSYTNAQTDVGDYANQLAAYAASDPYKQGGQFQTGVNRVLANSADATSQAANQELAGQARRTGGNATAANATEASIAEHNSRNLGADQAKAEESRIGSEAGFQHGILQAKAVPEQMENNLYSESMGGGNAELNTQMNAAAANQSFMDNFGKAFATNLGQRAAGAGQGAQDEAGLG